MSEDPIGKPGWKTDDRVVDSTHPCVPSAICGGTTTLTTLFVTRHPGAIEWAVRQGVQVDRIIPHLDLAEIQPGDVVIGTLPVQLAAAVCARGARFFNLSLQIPLNARGQELSADDLERFGARLEEYHVENVKC